RKSFLLLKISLSSSFVHLKKSSNGPVSFVTLCKGFISISFVSTFEVSFEKSIVISKKLFSKFASSKE
ncbi:MAG: hypothetical protein IIX47_07265, partial [Spirochaetaceae bacterium]|nr:hypothetical protein [Spirochaetaceae bacterium]